MLRYDSIFSLELCRTYD